MKNTMVAMAGRCPLLIIPLWRHVSRGCGHLSKGSWYQGDMKRSDLPITCTVVPQSFPLRQQRNRSPGLGWERFVKPHAEE